ncbi:MAG: DNA alkylation repair protein [Chloroflexota bacterium]
MTSDHRPLPDAALGRRIGALADTPEQALVALRDAGCTGATPAARLRAIGRGIAGALADGSPATALWLALRFAAEPDRDARVCAIAALGRSLATDPERSWQLLRRLGRTADDPVVADALALPMARGVLAERFRRAELEQLAFSDRACERALIGRTVARMPGALPRAARGHWDVRPALDLMGPVVGDADADVAATIARAWRALARVDAAAVAARLAAEAETAARTADGARATTIRAALPALPAAEAAAIRTRLGGLRRLPGAPGTSSAAAIARQFGFAHLADGAVSRQGERYDGGRR